MGVFTNCTTQQQPQYDMSGFAKLARAIRERKERKRQEQAALQQEQQRQRIIAMIEAGDCAGAENAALETEGVDTAARVRDYCKSRTAGK